MVRVSGGGGDLCCSRQANDKNGHFKGFS
jgi:hypothetical protein